MKIQVLMMSAFVAIAAPVAAQAQGVPGGIAHGVYEGSRRAGPIGAVVGGAVGGVVGGIQGVLGLDGPYYLANYQAAAPRVYHRRFVRARVHHRHRRHFR